MRYLIRHKLTPMLLVTLTFFNVTIAYSSGMVPETSVVIIEENDGEGVINVTNTDSHPVLLLTKIVKITEDDTSTIIITPPTIRVEPNKTQRIRFILEHKEKLKSEVLKRVIFEGIPPRVKEGKEINMTIRQNLPVIIRPHGLERDIAPWKHLVWSLKGNELSVKNPSPYIIRLGQKVKTFPDKTTWILPKPYILPGQDVTITPGKKINSISPNRVVFSPASSWGYNVDNFDAPLN